MWHVFREIPGIKVNNGRKLSQLISGTMRRHEDTDSGKNILPRLAAIC